MKTSNYWIGHFKASALQQRINWDLQPNLTSQETATILTSLQAWQLAETSEGRQLIAAATKYAGQVNDPAYIEAVELFIREEQKHGANLGRYLDRMQQPRKKLSWDDSLFRWTRHLNTSMEIWTLTVVVVESTAQIFYQSLKDATNCALLQEICTDILIDEAYHITFQTERLGIIYGNKNQFSRSWRKPVYKAFFYGVACVVWLGHRKLFKAGGNTFGGYLKKMRFKYVKTLETVTGTAMMLWA